MLVGVTVEKGPDHQLTGANRVGTEIPELGYSGQPPLKRHGGARPAETNVK